MNRTALLDRRGVKGQRMGQVIDFPSRDAACSSRGQAPAERPGQVVGQVWGQVVILPVIRIERYEEQPLGYFKPDRGEQSRKRKRRASRS